MTYSRITHLSTDHNVWLKSLDFYKEEIGTMKRKLQEFADGNPSTHSMRQVEHFQNQFIVQRNNLDVLKHDLNHYAEEMVSDIKYSSQNNSGTLLAEKISLKEKYEDFERVMNGLRHEFNDFLSGNFN